MAERGSGRGRVAAIVPAYNEQETLAEVVGVLQATPLVDEVIVVSDGSTDDTPAVGRALGARTLQLKRNHGKATAMATGVAHTDAPYLLFVDGDILNLTTDLVAQLIDPVVRGRSAMTIGVRNRGRLVNAVHRQTGPLLSGIRCLRREIFEAVPEEFLDGFCIETALNWACRTLRCRMTTIVLYNLKHLVKEKKRGFAAGVRARLEMFASVFAAWLRLRWTRPDLRPNGAPPHLSPELEHLD